MSLKLFNSKAFTVEGFTPSPTPEYVWPDIEKLNPRPISTWEGMDVTDIQEMRKPMMDGCMYSFETDKLEKINLGFLVFMKRMAGTFITLFPRDNYDFPVFSAELIENPGNLHFLMDMHPLRDLVIDEWYRQKYLDPVEPLWKEYADIHNDVNPNNWWRSFLSTYPVSGRHKPAEDRSNINRVAEYLSKYLDYYLTEVVAKAGPQNDAAGLEFANRKKKAIRMIYRTRDPGAGPLVRVMGVEGAKKIVACLF